MSPASSIAVVCTVAISCLPSAFRTISSPLESEAYRKVRSPSLGNGDRMVAVSDFSGLVSSACALASAAAMVPMDSLDRCMVGLLGDKVEAHRSGFRALRPDAMPGCFPGVLGHETFEFGLGPLMVEKSLPRGAEHAGKL